MVKTTVVVQRTLSEIMLDVAKLLGGFRFALATGGSTGTVIDTNRVEPDDYFNQGSLFLIDTTDDLAPVLEFSEVTNFVQSTGVFTLAPVLAAAVGAGDRYGVIPSYAPDKIIEAINITLLGIPYAMSDETTIDTVADQTEYALPTHITAINVTNVFVVGNDDDADDNKWVELYNWEVYTEGPGSPDLIRLPDGLSAGLDIKIVYVTNHRSVYDFDDNIDKSIPTELIVFRAANWLLMERWGESTGNETLQGRINYLLERAEMAESKYARSIPSKQSKIMLW